MEREAEGTLITIHVLVETRDEDVLAKLNYAILDHADDLRFNMLGVADIESSIEAVNETPVILKIGPTTLQGETWDEIQGWKAA